MNNLQAKSESVPMFQKVEVDVLSGKIFPLRSANKFKENITHREYIYQASPWILFISLVIFAVNLIVTYQNLDKFHSDVTVQVAALSFGFLSLISFAWSLYIAFFSFYDFQECSNGEYATIAEYKKTDPVLKAFTDAIRSSGRNWISNYEYYAIAEYVLLKRNEDQAADNAVMLDALREKALN